MTSWLDAVSLRANTSSLSNDAIELSGTFETDARSEIPCHLEADVDRVQETPYGTRYNIRASLETPIGRSLSVKTVWQIDQGQDLLRLITLVPD